MHDISQDPLHLDLWQNHVQSSHPTQRSSSFQIEENLKQSFRPSPHTFPPYSPTIAAPTTEVAQLLAPRSNQLQSTLQHYEQTVNQALDEALKNHSHSHLRKINGRVLSRYPRAAPNDRGDICQIVILVITSRIVSLQNSPRTLHS